MSGKAERLPKGQHSKYDEFTGVCMQKNPNKQKTYTYQGMIQMHLCLLCRSVYANSQFFPKRKMKQK